MSESTQFKATLQMLMPLFIKEVMKKRKLTQNEAVEMIYKSQLYEKLEDESTKLWHFSVQTLAAMLNEEINTGNISFPEEG